MSTTVLLELLTTILCTALAVMYGYTSYVPGTAFLAQQYILACCLSAPILSMILHIVPTQLGPGRIVLLGIAVVSLSMAGYILGMSAAVSYS